jgi:hypothetical protein
LTGVRLVSQPGTVGQTPWSSTSSVDDKPSPSTASSFVVLVSPQAPIVEPVQLSKTYRLHPSGLEPQATPRQRLAKRESGMGAPEWSSRVSGRVADPIGVSLRVARPKEFKGTAVLGGLAWLRVSRGLCILLFLRVPSQTWFRSFSSLGTGCRER